jgi:hypothetical protein
MAIDTRDKRASAMLVGILPVPNASIDLGDRTQLVWRYRGITPPPPTLGFVFRRTLSMLGAKVGDRQIIKGSE